MNHADWQPLEITPESAGVTGDVDGLLRYLSTADIADLLVRHRALVLRGFGVDEERLELVSSRLLRRREAYVHGNSPRTKVGDNIYTSTEFPPEYDISMHNELSYAHTWPARLLFCCAQPALTGGATPVIHGALWLESLSPEIRRDFEPGVCYRQYLHGGLGLGKSWQDTFETRDRSEVEAFLAAGDATWEWTGSGGLKVSQTRPATARHPVTGQQVWFCQVDQWHAATLGEETMRELMAIVPEDELPQSVTFADGSPIPADYAIEVRETGLKLAVDVGWQRGDLLLIDNVAVGHGRRAYTGARRILVSMSL
jgi:alpha-ketoglutarate-dependent taurine dioxygenase